MKLCVHRRILDGHIRKMWSGHVAHVEDNIEMYHHEMGWEDVDCIYVAQDRDQRQAVLDTVMNHWF
jgi:hypothetical protein